MAPSTAVPETYGTPWKKIAANWAKLGHGNHPSPHDLAIYKKYMDQAIANVAEPRVVVFGATPELRDMLARERGIAVTVLDLNLEMIRAMTELMTEAPDRETWIEGNWLEARLPSNTYQVVFGDQIRGNVPFARQEDLYRTIHRILAPGGAHVTRDTSHLPETRIHDPEELIAKFAAVPSTKETLTEFMNTLLFLTHRNPESTTDRMFSLLERHLDQPFIRSYYEQITEILPRGQSWNIGRSWDEVSRSLLRYFEIADKEQDDTVFADTTYVYNLKPRAISNLS